MCLINDTSVVRTERDSVTCWHIELDARDILLAEGLPAESDIDLGSRPWFSGADGVLFDPDFVAREMKDRCRPVAVDGPSPRPNARALVPPSRGPLPTIALGRARRTL
ncbi:Hint domain-containing protein [Methylobacterium sp. R2-1]|uniref:Hint domain-containing protein n=1 Tax=Methylobacterium sp. R2-1 TaxID=2587064 RepID=UPI00184FEBB3|nr:Hint domain-containing protein [Methylobacterium sp. R2-1]MBB2963485.1 hypothetical protein [Methylobacterium sp. R2-1]